MTLPIDIDTTYDDDAADPSVALHQQHHDEIHAKLNGIEAGAQVNDTAAEILAKLVTVDGAGSGLDADLLDGQSAAAFEAAGTSAAGIAAHVAAADPHPQYLTAAEGTAAFATAAQGATADTAVQPADLAAHAADTTSVHGIADTAALETTAGAQSKADAAEAAAEATAAAALSAHEAAANPHPIYLTAAEGNAAYDAIGAAAAAQAASQPLDADLTALAGAGNSAVLAATTAAFTTADETKLDGIAAGAEVNVQSDWNAVSGDAQILNKPTLGTAAATASTDYATAAQGATADTALQPVAAEIADALLLIVLDNADPPPADGVWLRRPA